MNLQIESAAISFALKYGAVSLPELVLWADELIVNLFEPPTELFDISLSKNLASALTALNLMGTISNSPEMARLVLSLFYANLNTKNPEYNRISRGLYDMYIHNFIPDEYCSGEMSYFWDALDLAEDGTSGNPAEVKEEMKLFLMKFKC